ncbi:MAG TPA: ATP-binding cassette domain-containing protein [Vicinamibacterales bacterium]|nr:ATP-binding cassette domain-containing protein [Vicinamibacterales bacterium]
MVEVQNLQKRYGAVAAVRDVSFAALNGHITGLLGENGAGKTTTLGMICGAISPDGGSIRVDGQTESPSNRQRRLGALLDHKGLYGRLTARENIRYFGELHGLRAAPLHDRVQQTVARLGLDAIADRRTAGFSQGERVRVALGRALIHAPANLVLDEPTNGLDISAIRGLRTLLTDLRNQGTCIIFSSHVLEDIRLLCDHVVVLSGGRVVAQGSPSGLCRDTGCDSLEAAFVQLTTSTEASWLLVP